MIFFRKHVVKHIKAVYLHCVFHGIRFKVKKIGCRETINFFYFYSHSKIIDIIKRCPDDRNKKSFPSYLSKSNIYRSPCQAQLYNSIRHLYNIGPTI